MFDRFTSDASRALDQAQGEARELGQDFLGTEHLLLGLLAEEHAASRVLRRLGVSRHDLLDEYRGAGICTRPTAVAPRRDALAAVGIDLDQVRRRIDEAFGTGALERTGAWQRAVGLRLTDRTKRALEAAIGIARRRGSERVAPEDLLLALGSVPGLAADLLRRRGIDLPRLRAGLADEGRRPA